MPKRKRAHWNDLERLRKQDHLERPRGKFKRLVLQNTVKILVDVCEGDEKQALEFVKDTLNDETKNDTEILNKILKTADKISRKMNPQKHYAVILFFN